MGLLVIHAINVIKIIRTNITNYSLSTNRNWLLINLKYNSQII